MALLSGHGDLGFFSCAGYLPSKLHNKYIKIPFWDLGVNDMHHITPEWLSTKYVDMKLKSYSQHLLFLFAFIRNGSRWREPGHPGVQSQRNSTVAGFIA